MIIYLVCQEVKKLITKNKGKNIDTTESAVITESREKTYEQRKCTKDFRCFR